MLRLWRPSAEATEAAGRQLDLDAGLPSIDPTRIVVAGRAEDSDGKTYASRRTISLGRFTVAAPCAHLERLDDER